MQKCLYLLCPTDCLEAVINDTFQQENYFYTSLGNSFNPDNETLTNLKCVIQKYRIRKICFVLANDNKIVKDALNNQDFSDITGLQEFYAEFSTQKEQSKVVWQSDNRILSILSYYFNDKIKNLQQELDDFCENPIIINARMYDRNKNTFTPIYSKLYYLEKQQLN